MSKSKISSLVIGLLFLTFLFLPSSVRSETTAELLSIIESLRNQISILQARILLQTPITTPSSTPQTLPATTPGVFSRDLDLNATGEDVSRLQNILINKGFLRLPAGTFKGSFGPLTKLALSSYQRSVGITPALGHFGPTTRRYLSPAVVTPPPVTPPTTPPVVTPPTAPPVTPPTTPPSRTPRTPRIPRVPAPSITPSLSLGATPTAIISGQSSTLSWSTTNATRCTASNGWSGRQSTSGTLTVTPQTTTTYTISCVSSTGTEIRQSVNITVGAPNSPALTLSALPTSITLGQSSTLTWVSQNTTACTASDGWTGTKALNGSLVVTPVTTTTYTLSCSNVAGVQTRQSATVSVGAPNLNIPEIPTNLSASNPTASSLRLNWTDSSNNETGFKIYRSTGNNTNFQFLAQVAAGIVSYTSSGLSAETQYFYKITAYNTTGESGFSNEASGTTARANSGVNLSPALTVMPSTVVRMAPATVHVHATDSRGLTWTQSQIKWNFDAGNNESSHLTTTDPRTGRSVDLASDQQGFNAAYVYETPGTYTIEVEITNEYGDTETEEETVVIEPNTRAIRYVDSQAGDDTFDGATPETAWKNFDSALLTRMTVENGSRDNVALLLKGGQTFTPTASLSFGDRKNFILGSYGSSEKATLAWGNTGSMLNLSSTENFLIKDINFRSLKSINDAVNDGVAVSMGSTPGKNRTIMNSTFEGVLEGNAFSRDIAATSGNQGMLLLNLTMGDSKAHHIITKSNDAVVIGVTAGTSRTEHIMRNLSQNNRLNTSWVNFDYKDNSAGKGTIRYQGVKWGTIFRSVLARGVVETGFDQARTQYIVLDGNVLSPGRVWGLQIDYNATDIGLRNNVFDMVVGRPLIKMASSCQVPGSYTMSNIDVVNNLFKYASGINNSTAISLVNTSGSCAASLRDLRISNNLFVADQTFSTGNNVLIKLESSSGAVNEVSNNVYPSYCTVYQCMSWGATKMNLATWLTQPVIAGEVVETRSFNPSSDFRSPNYSPSSGFTVVTGNGRMAPGVFEDFLGNERSLSPGSIWPAGAVYRSSSASNSGSSNLALAQAISERSFIYLLFVEIGNTILNFFHWFY